MNIRQLAVGIAGGVVVLAAVAFGANAVAVGGSGGALEAAANGSITVNGSLGVSAPGADSPDSGPPRIDPSLDGPPTDPDGDGTYEDLNGNGREDFDDVVVLFEYIDDPAVTDHVPAYDFNSNGRIDYDDVITLFEEV